MTTDALHADADAHKREQTLGLVFGFLAYGAWGFFPIYFKAVAAAGPLELLSHRVVWALALLLVLCRQQGLMGELRRALRPGRTLALLAATTVLIAANWLAYIWAIVSGHVVDASLGYFINPLVNVLLGIVVLKERLERPVVVAVAVAAAGVLWLTLQSRQPPWIALTLGFSFGLYGLLRKLVPVGAVTGLTVETMLLTPAGIAYLWWLSAAGHSTFLAGHPGHDVLLVLAGPITALPLLLFTGAARRLRLSTLGFLQYFSPTIQLLLAVLLYHEPFTPARRVAFVCIWIGLAIFGLYSLRRSRVAPAAGI